MFVLTVLITGEWQFDLCSLTGAFMVFVNLRAAIATLFY